MPENKQDVFINNTERLKKISNKEISGRECDYCLIVDNNEDALQFCRAKETSDTLAGESIVHQKMRYAFATRMS